MVPIVAYNYGARKPKRITKAIKLSIIYGVCIMLAGFAVFQLFPGSLLGIFSASDDMMAIGIPALRTISLSFLIAGFSVVASSVFQALGHGFLSLAVSVLRQLVVLLPAAFILSKSRWPWSLLVVLSHCRGVLRSDLLCVYTICV